MQTNNTETNETGVELDTKAPTVKKMIRRQRIIITLSVIILVILLLLCIVLLIFGPVHVVTKQTGLVALIESEITPPDIPNPDPTAIPIPDDDKIEELNEKLDKGKMCINMTSMISFKDSYSSGYFNIVNDKANNYPQFVTITLDSNDAVVYQSGLINPGECIPYAVLDVVLPAGSHECTATFAQVDTETNKICGKAAAKVVIDIKN